MSDASRRATVLAGAMAAVVLAGCQAMSTRTEDAAELKRTWDAAHVYLPADDLEIPDAVRITRPDGSAVLRLIMKPATERGDFARISDGRKFPVVIYMHGCTGIYAHNSASGAWLAGELGLAVIQPLSFARNYRPSNCDPATKSGGMFRRALSFRIAEANFAIREARTLPWIDGENVFLMGHSEGGITASKFRGENVNARIVEGATCHYGWPDWSGLAAPESEPVLALLGANDPWQKGKRWSGKHCGSLMSGSNGSRSMVITTGPYANRHAVLMDPAASEAVSTFIKGHMR